MAQLRRRFFADRGTVPCAFCSAPLFFEEATLDHIVPQSLGGGNGIHNLVIACAPCNSRRGCDNNFWEYWEACRLGRAPVGPQDSRTPPAPLRQQPFAVLVTAKERP